MAISTREERNPAAEIVEFVVPLTFEELPSESIRLAERCFIDTVGVTLAGTTKGAGKIAKNMMEKVGSNGPASVLGGDQSLSIFDATLVNGTAGHGLDYDDYTMVMPGHPSVTMLPGLLALAEREDVHGKNIITAFTAGFEVMCYLAAPMNPSHYERGWHSTATFGTFGATISAAKILNLDCTQCENALNITASMPAGINHSFGSMTKPLHVGQASRSGITAALLASEGFTGTERAISSDKGFFDLYAGEVTPDEKKLPQLGETWTTAKDGITVKKYPCCGATHTSIAAAQKLKERIEEPIENIEAIEVTTSQLGKDILNYEDPDGELECKFSMHYTVAAALARGKVGLDEFEEESINDQSIQQLRSRVQYVVDDELPYDSSKATVRVKLSDGTVSEEHVNHDPGSKANPLSLAELKNKFMECATRAIPEDAAEEIFNQFDNLREQSNVGKIPC